MYQLSVEIKYVEKRSCKSYCLDWKSLLHVVLSVGYNRLQFLCIRLIIENPLFIDTSVSMMYTTLIYIENCVCVRLQNLLLLEYKTYQFWHLPLESGKLAHCRRLLAWGRFGIFVVIARKSKILVLPLLALMSELVLWRRCKT